MTQKQGLCILYHHIIIMQHDENTQCAVAYFRLQNFFYFIQKTKLIIYLVTPFGLHAAMQQMTMWSGKLAFHEWLDVLSEGSYSRKDSLTTTGLPTISSWCRSKLAPTREEESDCTFSGCRDLFTKNRNMYQAKPFLVFAWHPTINCEITKP